MDPSLRKHFGRYSYRGSDCLGSGSYSQVFLGRDETEHSPVAIKVQEMPTDTESRAMLEAEVNIMVKLRSRHTVNLLDICRTASRVYFILEPCEGDLEHWLLAPHSLQEKQALAQQLVKCYLHLLRNRVLHRDLKPSNLLFKGRHLKLGDFGFAVKGSSFRDKYCVGSPNYMSPESLRTNTYSHRSDLWALGVILYEVFEGRLPWRADSEAELLRLIDEQPVTFQSQPPPYIQKLILGCLRVKPSHRLDPMELLPLRLGAAE
jgi:serine/threonine protein kinase